MGIWDWVDDFNEGFKRGAKQWSSDPLGETGKFLWNYVHQPKMQRIAPANKYLTNTHPTESQFRIQQGIGSLPIIGGMYSNYMRSQSLMEQQANWRNDYGIEWGDTKYPWLSSMWSADPGAAALGTVSSLALGGGAGAKISKNLKELYESDRLPSLKRKKEVPYNSFYGVGA